jgi:hypothetical protein
MAEHLSSEQKVVGLCQKRIESHLEYVVIRRFRVRIPGKIYSPVGPMVRRLTTDSFYSYHAMLN